MNKVILGIKLMTGILLIAQVVAVATGHMDIEDMDVLCYLTKSRTALPSGKTIMKPIT